MKYILLFAIVVMQLTFQGCSTKAPKKQEMKIIYPPYPDKPRILYLGTYRGESNEKIELNMMDSLLGETIESKASNPVIVKPYGVGISNGILYAVDTATKTVFMINEKTRDVSYLGRDARSSFGGPVSVAFDKAGLVYVSDVRQKKIYSFTPEGDLTAVFGDRLDFVAPTGIAIDKELNRLYVADTKGHNVKAFDLATKKMLFSIGKRGKAEGEFNFPTNLAVDRRNHNIVVTDTQNFRIEIFDKDGKFIRTFGHVGDRPGTFARPKGVGVDSEGHIYVADTAFNNVQVFNEMGELMTYFGSAGYVQPGTFRLIAGLYIDEDDKIIIADGFTGRIQTFQYFSKKWQKKHPKEYKEHLAYIPQSVIEQQKKDAKRKKDEKEKEMKKDGGK